MSKLQVLAPIGALSMALASATIGCGSDQSGSREEQAQATVKAQITTQLTNLVNARRYRHVHRARTRLPVVPELVAHAGR